MFFLAHLQPLLTSTTEARFLQITLEFFFSYVYFIRTTKTFIFMFSGGKTKIETLARSGLNLCIQFKCGKTQNRKKSIFLFALSSAYWCRKTILKHPMCFVLPRPQTVSKDNPKGNPLAKKPLLKWCHLYQNWHVNYSSGNRKVRKIHVLYAFESSGLMHFHALQNFAS